MLRITTAENLESVIFAMEGRLCGAWAAEAREAWLQFRERANGHPIILELAGVTFVDTVGETLLEEMLATGAQVHSNGVLINHIVQRMRNQPRAR